MTDISTFLRRNQKSVIVSLIDVDPHAVEQSTSDMFADHENYFFGLGKGFVWDKTDATKTVRAVLSDPFSFERVALAGRHLILRQHSVSSRLGQLRKAIQRIRAGAFVRSDWESGSFRCRA